MRFLVFSFFVCVLLTSCVSQANELLMRGSLQSWARSPAIDVRGYKRIFVGIASGDVACYHESNPPQIRLASVNTYFEMGSSWYKQDNCRQFSRSGYCDIEAKQGRWIRFAPLSSRIKLIATPRENVGPPSMCRGSIVYEVYGER
jgi:hypothetical protein